MAPVYAMRLGVVLIWANAMGEAAHSQQRRARQNQKKGTFRFAMLCLFGLDSGWKRTEATRELEPIESPPNFETRSCLLTPLPCGTLVHTLITQL